jgi:hypothetical protein
VAGREAGLVTDGDKAGVIGRTRKNPFIVRGGIRGDNHLPPFDFRNSISLTT